ncbi:hypothetical protein GCM10007989_27020 [Devosia pacifica]|uniref:ROK family transcriptional regulator n=1 Tax=Devosia pacifica TaxID=1335967 RepID=A0A918VUB8_9HYPH|nr:ROK family transcriptional regulator [Devosia pacifica]GHA29945.1 hypothetical protein GCM10007989_27020 [Devosia pacifica]
MNAQIPTLSEAAKAVMAGLLAYGEATRRDLAHHANVSFPTVTAALAELGRLALIEEVRREQGPRGRATIVYGIGRTAGWVLGCDIGSTQISLMARDLGGTIRARETTPHGGDPLAAADRAAAHASKFVERMQAIGPIRSIALAVNQIVPRDITPTAGRHGITHAIVQRFADQLGAGEGTPLLVENNVNCAAVAEHHDGHLRGCKDAAYMQIGVGLGLGFFCDGALIRGAHGAGGELAQIPLSWSADAASPRDAIEQVLGERGLVYRVQQYWRKPEPAPQTLDEVFALDAQGDPHVHAALHEHAIALARVAATIATILDPEKLVLGGGLTRSGAFTRRIIEEFSARDPSTQIAQSEKHSDATVEGATVLARDLAISQLLGQFYRPLLQRPTTWSLS